MNKIQHILLVFSLCISGVLFAQSTDDTSIVIMTPAQIVQYNAALVAQGNLHLTDFTLYRDSTHLQYGLAVRPADLRVHPTDEVVYEKDCTENCFDRNQESQIRLGEGVIIHRESDDHEWYFVTVRDDYGWVRREHIALCDYGVMMKYLNQYPFAMTTTLSYETILGEEMHINMGTRLPLHGKKVIVPSRNKHGELHFQTATLKHTYSNGFVPYTWENIKKLAFRQEHNPYGWGNTDGWNDCSSYVASIYRCMGIILPRNTGDMCRISRFNDQFQHDLTAEKLEKYPAGTILLLPGHAMMLLDDPEPHIIHCYADRYNPDGTLMERVMSTEKTVVINFFKEKGHLLDIIDHAIIVR